MILKHEYYDIYKKLTDFIQKSLRKRQLMYK